MRTGGGLRLLREGLHDHCLRNSHLDFLSSRAILHVLGIMLVHDGAVGFNCGLLNCRLRLLHAFMTTRLSLLRVTVYARTRDHRSL